MRRKFDILTTKKTSLEKMFNSLIDRTEELLINTTEIKNVVPTLRKNERALAAIFQDCKLPHHEIIELPLERQYTENEIEWIRQIHSQYRDISGQIESVSSNEETKTHAKESHNPLRMEKVRMPSFDGNIRPYPQFKGDFIKHIIPTISEVNAPFVLRSCLSKEPLECVITLRNCGLVWMISMVILLK